MDKELYVAVRNFSISVRRISDVRKEVGRQLRDSDQDFEKIRQELDNKVLLPWYVVKDCSPKGFQQLGDETGKKLGEVRALVAHLPKG